MDIVIVKSEKLFGIGTVALRTVVGGNVLEIDGVDQALIFADQDGNMRIRPSTDGTFKVLYSGDRGTIPAGSDAYVSKGKALRIVLTKHDKFIRIVGGVTSFK